MPVSMPPLPTRAIGGTVDPTGTALLSPTSFTVMDGVLYLSAADGAHGAELWRTDGTQAGTFLVKDINPDAPSGSPTELTVVGDTVYFAANDGAHATELWKTDGTAAETVMVADINPAGHSLPTELTAVNGTLFFAAFVDTGGSLWTTDGTAAGTVMVKDSNPSGDGHEPT